MGSWNERVAFGLVCGAPSSVTLQFVPAGRFSSVKITPNVKAVKTTETEAPYPATGTDPFLGVGTQPGTGSITNRCVPLASGNEIVAPNDDWRSPSRATDHWVPVGSPVSVNVTGHVGFPNERITVTLASCTRTDPRPGEGSRPLTPETEKLYVPLGSMKEIAVPFPITGVPFSSTDQLEEEGVPFPQRSPRTPSRN